MILLSVTQSINRTFIFIFLNNFRNYYRKYRKNEILTNFNNLLSFSCQQSIKLVFEGKPTFSNILKL